jgi:hypothetical protein
MTAIDWNACVATALSRLQQDRSAFPAVRYMEIIDDVAAGKGSADDLARRHGTPDMVSTALDHVTIAVHGGPAVPRIEEGGWYAREGDRFAVAPDFAHAWRDARRVQTQFQALQAI